ncbi:DUF423 domain-containing protein [Luteibacter sp. PPL201]|uniref:DUF423 domain-containing protein n=1 Tax=Luteibacter sahnii TaxID=3021977 RepID=A0ABT6B716_9GAMM|nr:DUF423 domain-containing protein [Luteibacter sp. PPL193]MDY1548172.1 DUF423 domain-containing protein [Luteibacter sp. PPL193]
MRQRVSRATAMLVAAAGLSAVALGAFGAHALRGTIGVDALSTWHIGVEYHFWHALALFGAAAGLAQGAWRRAALALFPVGIVLFSGSLYALALGAPRWTGAITPLGGVCFIAGWVAVGMSLLRDAEG